MRLLMVISGALLLAMAVTVLCRRRFYLHGGKHVPAAMVEEGAPSDV